MPPFTIMHNKEPYFASFRKFGFIESVILNLLSYLNFSRNVVFDLTVVNKNPRIHLNVRLFSTTYLFVTKI